MDTIALRFADNFAPVPGTIALHEEMINRLGYVWYGKLGAPISPKNIKLVMEETNRRILLIHSGKTDRYWAYINQVQCETPPQDEIPEYYRGNASQFRTWFKVTKIEKAERNVLKKCRVKSSGVTLSEASSKSMSPFFIIQFEEN